ncbi:MAG: glycosyltransferase family 4 protein [Acidimicrobiales bacterium]
MTPRHLTVALYDGLPDGGHRRWLAEPLATALCDLGHDVVVFRPRGSGREPDDRPVRVDLPPARSGEPGRSFISQLPAARRSLRAALDAAADLGADAFVDLEVDDRVWMHSMFGSADRFVAVLHSREQLSATFGRDRLLRPAIHRARLRAFTKTLDKAEVVICLRDPIAEAVETLCPGTRTVVIGYPVVSDALTAAPPTDGSPGDGRLRILVPGHIRPDKGLDELLAALVGFSTPTTVEVTGAQSPGLDLPVSVGPHAVVVDDRPVSEPEMGAAHHRADLVLAPLPAEFAGSGRARGTLLKAAAYGVPVVTTPAGLAQLPDGYGCVVVDPFTPAALRAALEGAVGRLDALAVAAAGRGPDHIRRHHTFEVFAAGLTEALDRGRAR